MTRTPDAASGHGSGLRLAYADPPRCGNREPHEHHYSTVWCRGVPIDHEKKLSVIGADYMQIDALAKKLHKAIRTEHDYTSLRDTKRGRSFDVVLDRGRIARVTVELDRVEDGRV